MITVLCLAVGLFCFTVVSYYVRDLSAPFSHFENYERMANLIMRTEHGSSSVVFSETTDKIAKASLSGISKIGIIDFSSTEGDYLFERENDEYPIHMLSRFANEDFFKVFGSDFSLRPGEVVISQRIARKVYGKENPVGQKIHTVRSKKDSRPIDYYTITGVFGGFTNTNLYASDVYFPFEESDIIRPYAILLLNQPEDVPMVNQQLKGLFEDKAAEKQEIPYVKLISEQKPANRQILLILITIGSLILLAGMINFLKLSIQSFYNRSRELSLRKSLGAGRKDLFMILFPELLGIILFTALVSFALTELLLPVWYSYLPKGTDEMRIDTLILFIQQGQYIGLLILICASVAAFAVWRIRRLGVISVLHEGRHPFRNIMMVLQLVICFFFIGSMLGLQRMAGNIKDAMYAPIPLEETKNILSLNLNQAPFEGCIPEIKAQIEQISGVEETLGFSRTYLGSIRNGDKQSYLVRYVYAESHYFDFFHMPMRGRLSESSPYEIYVSKNTAGMLSETGATDLFMPENRNIYKVMDVFREYPYLMSSNGKKEYWAVFPNDNKELTHWYIKCTPGQISKVKTQIERVLRNYYPAPLELSMSVLYEQIWLNDNSGIFILRDLAFFLAIIALIITMFSIYSAISLDTQSRQKEVAIRKINGADHRVISLLFARSYLFMIFIAFAISSVFLIFILRLYSSNVKVSSGYQSPLFWMELLLLVSLMVAITVAYKIKKVSCLNPAEAIRTE
ncbi:MAG: ABC transporter permease [Bacteroidales bacterium]|nr:ABC transporter permease [Bacteroidales bacterium]